MLAGTPTWRVVERIHRWVVQGERIDLDLVGPWSVRQRRPRRPLDALRQLEREGSLETAGVECLAAVEVVEAAGEVAAEQVA